MSLAESLLAAQGDQVFLRAATVVTTSPLTVDLGGSSVQATSRLSAYTPVAKDVVLLICNKTSIIVLGKLIPS